MTEANHNGSVSACIIKGLVGWDKSRVILKHLAERWNNAGEWTTGED